MNIKVKPINQGAKTPFILYNQKERGITLIALIISIIVLVILAAISIKAITDGGILDITDKGISMYLEEDQRERLVFALEAARIEKERNKNFDKNTDLDKIILNDIPEAIIEGDIVKIGDKMWLIDRDKFEANDMNDINENELGDREKLVTALEKARKEKERNKDFDKNTDLDKIILKDIPEANINGSIIAIGNNSYFLYRDNLEVNDIKGISYQGKNIASLEEVEEKTYKISYIEEEEKLYVYGLDEIPDLSGKNRTLTLRNGATVQKDSSGKSYLSFDGTDDYGQIGELEASIDWAGGFTVEFEAAWDAFGTCNRILDFGNGQSSNNIIIYNEINQAILVINIINGSTNQVNSPLSTISAVGIVDKYKIEYTKSGSEYKITTYKNGVQASEYNRNATINNMKRTLNYVGKSNWSGDSYFKGKIYSLKITQANGEKILDYDLNKTTKNEMTLGYSEE